MIAQECKREPNSRKPGLATQHITFNLMLLVWKGLSHLKVVLARNEETSAPFAIELYH
jgi:hypothetical protein